MGIKRMVVNAFALALVFVVTAFSAISIPFLGYVNVGDSVILLFATVLNPIASFFVAGVGSMMSDLYLGYPQYALFTLIIKGCEGFMVAHLYRVLPKKLKRVGLICGILIMMIGYYIADVIISGSFVASLSGLQSNGIQGLVCLIFGSIAQASFYRVVKQHPSLFEVS